MKIRDVLSEAIPTRPRSHHYYLMRAKQLRALAAVFQKAGELLHVYGLPEYELEKIVRPYDPEFNAHQFRDVGYALQQEHGPFDPKPIADAMDSYVQYGSKPAYDFFKYIPERLSWVEEEIQKRDWLFQVLDHIPTQIVQLIHDDQEWKLLDTEYREPEEIEPVQKFIEAMKLLTRAVPQYKRLLTDLRQKLDAWQSLRAAEYNWNGGLDKYRPEHAEVETLYHATAYANEVAQHGFAAEKPTDRFGVGNFGQQATISFTHDLKIATDIMRCLKELTMIANGQLKARTIADWIRRENIPNFPWNEFLKVFNSNVPLGMPQYTDTTLDRLGIEKTAELYNKYIWLSKIHPNPAFAGMREVVNALVGRPVNDIGIVACQVRLDPSQSEYKWGESEFRVNPNAVQSIKRIM